MRILGGGKAVLTAVAALLSMPVYPGDAVQSMPQNWFRSKIHKVGSRLRWLKSPKPVPAADIAEINSLSAFANRLNLVGLKGPRTEVELYEIFGKLRECFRGFAPPPGLAMDFSPIDTMSPDEAIGQLFTFIPPSRFIHDPTQPGPEGLAPASYAELAADDAAGGDVPLGQAPEDAVMVQPLRLVKYSNDPKHILANIIRNVYLHFRGPTCQQAAKRLDGARRLFLRNNSKAAALEPLLLYSLIQGNIASASKFPAPASADLPGEGRDALLQHMAMFKSPANVSSSTGIYDSLLLATYFDLAKAGESKQLRRFEKLLQKPVDESLVGNKLFGNSLASPTTHATITAVGNVVGTDEELLQKVVEKIGQMAIDSSDAASVLLPAYPKTAAFVRGVSFFVFEGVFKQNGPYVMPGLPCGDNLSGNMLETVTKKKLGTNYYVYKYTRPLTSTQIPSDVWEPHPESEVAQYLTQSNLKQGDYMYSHMPRVCARTALFQKCARRPPARVETAEEQLCDFIYSHQAFFFQVEGKGVYALRKNMQKNLPRGGLIKRAGAALGRGLRSIRRFFFSKTSLALVVGAGLTTLCVSSGLLGVFGGAGCALGAAAFTSAFMAVAPFKAKPDIPLSVATYLSTDFERNLEITSKMIGAANAQSQGGLFGAPDQ
ncbi:hypothetical protein Emed_003289 [Eimeria media]